MLRNRATIFVTIAVSALIIGVGASAVKPAAAQSDPSVAAFWTKFKNAVIAGDKEAVSTMVQFPVAMSYGVPSIRTKAQLLRRYRDLFNRQADASRCFAEAKPEIDASSKSKFSVACKDAAGNEVVIYGFVKIRGVWKLKSLDNINE